MNKALVCEIEKYATHDGPGIRTVVFLKGCPLTCLWCANPETQSTKNEIYYNENKCIGCLRCVKSCPVDAINSENGKVVINRKNCTSCQKCIKACPVKAFNIVAKIRTVEETFEEVYRDLVFYQNSGGGLTVSGGEVLMHKEFVTELLKMCKENYINTAIETSGFGSWDTLETIAKYCDLVMIDIKHTNDETHKKLTGVSNKIILENLKCLTESYINNKVIIRVPVIPGINDSEENIRNTVEIAKVNGIKEIHLLPYHSLGKDKYRQLERAYSLLALKNLKENDIENLKVIVENAGLKCVIGG